MPELPLAGCGIAITRPLDQAQHLAELVRRYGGQPILYPLLAIAPLDDYGICDAAIDKLDTCDWAIFISSNAVQHGMARVLRRHPDLPDRLHFAAIGPGSATSLRQAGVTDVLTPEARYDSESLLALPQLQQVQGMRVMIFRGVGGRELLADTLAARGAEVVFAECYRRSNPQTGAGALPQLWQNRQLHAFIVTSSEAMRNLIDIAEGAAWLRETLVCTNHARIAELARHHGLHAVAAPSSGDEAILQCLIQHCPGRK